MSGVGYWLAGVVGLFVAPAPTIKGSLYVLTRSGNAACVCRAFADGV